MTISTPRNPGLPTMQNADTALFQWRLDDLLPDLKEPPFSVSQGNLRKYHHKGHDYVIKIRPDPLQLARELKFLQAAADMSVEVRGYIRRSRTSDDIVGFVMPCLKVIDPARMTVDEKIMVFRQIRDLIPQLHDRHKIIHGDIKLSNFLLDGAVVKFCDFGNSAWMSEVVYPTALSIRYSSPYRLGSNPNVNPRRLIAEEDIYASGIAVWELFVGEIPFGPYVSDDEDFELWDRIVDGFTVDVEKIEFEEARVYVKECLSIKKCLNISE